MSAVQNGDTPASPWETYCGLTKRELFAAMAMQGLLASNAAWGPDELPVHARIAAQLADALLAELEKDGAA